MDGARDADTSRDPHLVCFLITFFLCSTNWLFAIRLRITTNHHQNAVGEQDNQDLRRRMGGALQLGTLFFTWSCSYYLLIFLLIANLFYLILFDFSTYLSACLLQTYFYLILLLIYLPAYRKLIMDLMTLYFCLYLWSNLLSKNKWLRQA